MSRFAVRPAGRHGVLLEPADPADVPALRAALRGILRSGVEIVPSATTVLVLGVSGPERKALTELEIGGGAVAGDEGSLVEVPVLYDGEDLAEVSRLTGLPESEVVDLHTSSDFTVGFCGFSPGFAYLTGIPEVLQVPRRDTPRTRVPAGSVAIAGLYSAVYPGPSPGGWRLIGRTSTVVWDPSRTPPALLSPGTRVRFRAVDALDEPPAATTTGTRQDVHVIRAGAMTTVQDAGRPGYADVGVPCSGALDLPSLRLANRLVGNDEYAAALETTFTGCAVVLETARYFAVTGAPARVTVDGHDVGPGGAVYAHAGATVEIHAADAGVRGYLAIAGGIDAPAILGSRSTDLLSGLGPSPLRDGDALALGQAESLPPGADESFNPQPVDEPVLRLTPGPRDDWFTEAAWETLKSSRYEVTADSNRVGLRLDGPALERRPELRGVELASEGMPHGALQVPPDGRPVLFLADHPTTGGYPVIGCVDLRDLHHAGQARPGTGIRFRSV